MRLTLLFVLFPFLVCAQNINRVEYYWDTDPGPGNGTSIAFAPAPSLTLSPNIPLTSTTEGFHVLYFRARSAGKWSLPLAQPVWVQRGAQVASASLITKLEYFVDTDPGRGNGVNVPLTPAANVALNFTLLLGTLPEGFHLIYFRARTADNQWSLPLARPVFVQRNAQTAASPSLRQLEYFYDNDPGFGNGISVPMTLSSENQSIVLDLTGVSPGFHILHIRAEDTSGRWSPILSRPFVAEYSGDNIVAIEYFFTDGTTTSPTRVFNAFTPGTDVTVNFAAALSALVANSAYEIHLTGINARGQRTQAGILAFTTPTVICDPLSAPVTTGANLCSSGSAALNASGATAGQSYLWYPDAVGTTPIAGATNSTYNTPVLTSTTTYYVAILNGTCESARTATVATIQNCNTAPSMATANLTVPAGGMLLVPLLNLITDPDSNIDTASIQVIVPPPSGAATQVTDGMLTLDYSGLSFAGQEQITVQACDLAAACTQQVLSIEVVGDITIYNAVSPNGDGKNDFLFISYIDAMPQTSQNKLTIYNRWGQVVYEATDYDNVTAPFQGLNKNGEVLPSGVYFYTLEFPSGGDKKTGFISLRQ